MNDATASLAKHSLQENLPSNFENHSGILGDLRSLLVFELDPQSILTKVEMSTKSSAQTNSFLSVW